MSNQVDTPFASVPATPWGTATVLAVFVGLAFLCGGSSLIESCGKAVCLAVHGECSFIVTDKDTTND